MALSESFEKKIKMVVKKHQKITKAFNNEGQDIMGFLRKCEHAASSQRLMKYPSGIVESHLLQAQQSNAKF